MTTSSPAIHQKKNLVSVILLTGLLVGALDITAAMVKFYIDTGRGPAPIFKYIASSVFGSTAYSGGWIMVFTGLLFHFIIACSFTIFYYLIYSKINLLSKNEIIARIVYGLFMLLVIYVPIIKLPDTSFNIQVIAGTAIFIIILLLPTIIISGIVYGIFVWAVMNFMVVPMTKISQRPFDFIQSGIQALILICMIGIPLSLIAHRYYSKKVTV
jgi:hypothetical protein